MLTDAFLSRLDSLALIIRGRAQGGAGGSRKSRQTGSSAEFSDYREYIPGDDIRRLDWNAYARFDRLFLKLFMEEQESMVTILLDSSASMAFKWATSRKAAEALGYLALTGGDRLCVYSLKNGQALRSQTLSGRSAFPQVAGFLDSCAPDGKNGTLTEAVRHTENLKKGMCFLITDGYTEDALREAVNYLRYMKQETAVLHVLSAEELRPDLDGALRLTDSENGEQVDLVADREALDCYQETLDRFLEEIRENCASAEARYILLDNGKPFEECFIPLLSQGRMI